MNGEDLNSLLVTLVEGDVAAAQELADCGYLEVETLDMIRNLNLPEHIFEKLSETHSWELLIALVSNSNVSTRLKHKIVEASNSGIYHYEIQQVVLMNPDLAPSIYSSVLNGHLPAMWSHLDLNESERRESALATAVADNDDISAQITLGALAESRGDFEEAQEIWQKCFGGPPKFADLLTDSPNDLNFEDMKSLARHPMTSRATLFRLSYLNDEDLDSFVAANPSCPPCVVAYYIESLSENGDPVTLALGNPGVPSYVWDWFRESLHSFQDWPPHKLLLSTAAMNHGLPLDLMTALAAHPDIDVRREISKNPCVPETIRKTVRIV